MKSKKNWRITMQNDLKPCPFCGGEAIYNEKKILIECKKCRATIYGHKSYKGVTNYKFWLASLWNRRVENDTM